MEGVPGSSTDRGMVHCARCGASIRLARPGIRWCPACGVFLCESCSRADHGPGAHHPLRKNRWMLVVLFLLLAVTFSPLAAYTYGLDQQDLARANMPVTRVADLVPGSIAKVNGTIQAGTQVVIQLLGSGDNAYWLPSPFNVSDSTGTVAVDPTPLTGSSSYRVIERGVHDDDWWNGDSISVIGEVRAGANGTAYVVAQYIARSPALFYRASVATPLLIGLGLAGIAGTVVSAYASARRRMLHRQNESRFPFKIQAADVCRDCGAALPGGTQRCPSCGRPTGLAARTAAIGFEGSPASLPTLRMERRFSARSPMERTAVVIFGLIVPALLLSGAAWLFVNPPYGVGQTAWYLVIVGVVMAGVVDKDYLTAETVVLSPNRIETRRLGKTQIVDPSEVNLVLTMHRNKRFVHAVLTRGDEFVGFGPGLSRDDFEKARDWLKSFAAARGLEYKEVDVREAMELVYRRTQKGRGSP